MRFILIAATVALAIAPVRAAPPPFEWPEETAALAPGPNVEVAEANCGSCHSVDYITTQPRRMADPRAFWTAEVTKMRRAYGAPVEDGDAKLIIDYLSATYGQ